MHDIPVLSSSGSSYHSSTVAYLPLPYIFPLASSDVIEERLRTTSATPSADQSLAPAVSYQKSANQSKACRTPMWDTK